MFVYRKQYVGLSVIVCLLICSLVTFFMFPRPVLVEDGGIRSVIVHFDRDTSRVLINMTVSVCECVCGHSRLCVTFSSFYRLNHSSVPLNVSIALLIIHILTLQVCIKLYVDLDP